MCKNIQDVYECSFIEKHLVMLAGTMSFGVSLIKWFDTKNLCLVYKKYDFTPAWLQEQLISQSPSIKWKSDLHFTMNCHLVISGDL